MADPLRDQDSSSRIEELLLAGLDHYFSGHHELAISVWTRVLFLDRSHARARAYIERARGAIAERQREGEELLQTGVAAFERGDIARARELLAAALDRHSRPEEALAVIERMDRLAPAGPPSGGDAVTAKPARRPPPGRTLLAPERSGVSATTVAALLAVGLAAGALIVIGWTSGTLPWVPVAARPSTSVPLPPLEPLPVPSASDVSLARANVWYRNGRLHDALAALDAIRPGDPLRPRADELRETIQQKLLEASRTTDPR